MGGFHDFPPPPRIGKNFFRGSLGFTPAPGHFVAENAVSLPFPCLQRHNPFAPMARRDDSLGKMKAQLQPY